MPRLRRRTPNRNDAEFYTERMTACLLTGGDSADLYFAVYFKPGWPHGGDADCLANSVFGLAWAARRKELLAQSLRRGEVPYAFWVCERGLEKFAQPPTDRATIEAALQAIKEEFECQD